LVLEFSNQIFILLNCLFGLLRFLFLFSPHVIKSSKDGVFFAPGYLPQVLDLTGDLREIVSETVYNLLSELRNQLFLLFGM
jgi:hypothetical protein